MKNNSYEETTQFILIEGKRLAYRRFGSGKPLVLVNRFRGTMDTWDPLFLSSLATKNELILFDYPGIGESEGQLPLNILDVAKVVIDFVDALSVERFNVLGWSYGGLVAQTMVFLERDKIKRGVLIGTNPPGENATPIAPTFFERALKTVNDLEDEYILFFEPGSKKSRQAARESHSRINKRLDRNLIPKDQEVFQRYFSGAASFKADPLDFRSHYQTLETPVIVISGDHDISFAAENWFPLLKKAPTLQHIIFNNAGHAPHFQFPEQSTGYINVFLNS